MFGWRKRLGYISPGALEISAYDFYLIAPEGVGLVAVTAHISDWGVSEYDKNLSQIEDAATYLAHRGVDMVIHAGAPPVASRGSPFMRELIGRITDRTGLPSSTAMHSAMEAFRSLGARRVVVVTPFPKDTHAHIVSMLQSEGFEVPYEARMEADFFRLHEVGQYEVFRFVTSAVKRAGPVDAAYVPCPQWQVFEMVPHLERDARIPFVTSDGGDFWYAFKVLGVTDVRPGHGILLDRLREEELSARNANGAAPCD